MLTLLPTPNTNTRASVTFAATARSAIVTGFTSPTVGSPSVRKMRNRGRSFASNREKATDSASSMFVPPCASIPDTHPVA